VHGGVDLGDLSINERVELAREVLPQRPAHEGRTGEHVGIFAEVARQGYVPHLAPDFAYINEAPFYERPYFAKVYAATAAATSDFTQVSEDQLVQVIQDNPRALLVLRTVLGLTKDEFAHSIVLVAEVLQLERLTAGKVDSMEKRGTAVTVKQARVVGNHARAGYGRFALWRTRWGPAPQAGQA
jgi:hypothetical protein